jgi:alkanesulfonate monooxygenase SsuD/methylene tetrahydromethanopterin reductase-like flavin-dependent oxidoreductase (luciferase family)
LLEKGKFHGIFIADVLVSTKSNQQAIKHRHWLTLSFQGAYDVYKGPRNPDPAIISGAQWPVNEPLATVPAMAAATENIGFGVTVSTTYEQVSSIPTILKT